MAEGRLIAIGDVHGCVHALEAVLEAIELQASDRLVFLGDMIDCGRDTREVLERIIELKKHSEVVLIEGNHEEMLYAARKSAKALRYWENCGGVATLNSYRFGAALNEIPKQHWELLDLCVPFYETDEFIFTHANYLPDVPMAQQPEYQLRWALLEPAELRPHCSGKPVTVGHTEQSQCEVLDLGFVACIDTACWQYGWLTAMDVRTRQVWQASRWRMLRDQNEAAQRGRLPQIKAG